MRKLLKRGGVVLKQERDHGLDGLVLYLFVYLSIFEVLWLLRIRKIPIRRMIDIVDFSVSLLKRGSFQGFRKLWVCAVQEGVFSDARVCASI